MPASQASPLQALFAAAEQVVGPLPGYHHETYAVRLPAPGLFGQPAGWVKLRDPRPGLLWFDRRCFASEDALLTELAGRVTRVPAVGRIDSLTVQGFIEGCTLAEVAAPGEEVPAAFADQIVRLFRELLAVDPRDPALRALHSPVPADGDSAAFARDLVRFTFTDVVERSLPHFDTLFHRLGIHPRSARSAARSLEARLAGMTPRPFALLHGDVHRANLIVDREGALWTIDWELALIGDPLYDLATHLHLMRYPAGQESEVVARWAEAAEQHRPGAAAGVEADLPRYLAFKQIQSVYTDVIRQAYSTERGETSTAEAAKAVSAVLDRAAHALPSPTAVGTGEIEQELQTWLAAPREPRAANTGGSSSAS
ncbi:aminoglycoside phosphotransferase family protein [Streptomyces synnematoformans]|uniref:Aminoglycoside phosphotransferase domain-containing protein n=1 Tax=Streptomyces synnematoformans TaxID=415721 RepID=A0ABP5J886_9ACTN